MIFSQLVRALTWGITPLYGGGDAPQATTTVNQLYSPEEAARRTALMTAAEQLYNRQKGTWASMMQPGAMSPETQQAQQMISSAATGPGQQAATAAGGALRLGLSGDLLDPTKTPGFQRALSAAIDPITSAYMDPGGVFSRIRTNFMGGNSGGRGTREGVAADLAGSQYLKSIGDVSAGMSMDAYGKGLDFMKSSMAFAPNMYNLMMQPGISLGAVGQQKEAYTQAGQQWQAQAPWAEMAPWASMVTGFSNPSTVTQGTAPASRGPGAMGILGGAAMGAYIGSVVPGIGTAVGAGAGALLGLLGS